MSLSSTSDEFDYYERIAKEIKMDLAQEEALFKAVDSRNRSRIDRELRNHTPVYQNGRTLLMAAVENNLGWLVIRILGNMDLFNIYVNAKNPVGDTALMICVQKDSMLILSCLLRQRPNLSPHNKQGKTAMMLATPMCKRVLLRHMVHISKMCVSGG
jgi:ankyrin repeat protein